MSQRGRSPTRGRPSGERDHARQLCGKRTVPGLDSFVPTEKGTSYQFSWDHDLFYDASRVQVPLGVSSGFITFTRFRACSNTAGGVRETI